MRFVPDPEIPITPAVPYPAPWRVFTCPDSGRVWIETADEARLIVCDIPGDMETIEGPELRNADLLAAAPTLLDTIERTYHSLLRCPPSVRIHIQAELCTLRNAIAEATGRDRQDVQEEWEERARAGR